MKFVIHHHITKPEHYDLMIEKDDVLHTWQIPEKLFQEFINGNQIEIEQIQDHRKKYLNYEGPISCDRGMVKIYDTGEYIEKSWDMDIILQLQGNRLDGQLSLLYNSGKYLLFISKK